MFTCVDTCWTCDRGDVHSTNEACSCDVAVQQGDGVCRFTKKHGQTELSCISLSDVQPSRSFVSWCCDHIGRDRNDSSHSLHPPQDRSTAWGYFKSTDGSQVFLTDDCASLRGALHTVWPTARQLLSFFHLLQALWWWLCDAKHRIPKDDRTHLLHLSKDMLYADSEDSL